MSVKNETDYAIKYRVIALDEGKYFLYPEALISGHGTENGLLTKEGMVPYLFGIEDLDNEFVVDCIYSKNALKRIYDFSDEDDGFLLDYYFEDVKDTFLFVDLGDGIFTKKEIHMDMLFSDDSNYTYLIHNGVPQILLNEKAVDELLGSRDIGEIRLNLERNKVLLKKFLQEYNEQGITKINFSNGDIVSATLDREIVDDDGVVSCSTVQDSSDLYDNSNSDISYAGLKKHLHDRIYGHDEEIDTFAQKLYMNYTAEDGETVESILLVGPTGTGKTETVKAACEYLDIPSFETNASNIVPQGIKGMSIEDVIVALYEKAGKNLKKAERGLVFLDEFDKLNATDLDIKTPIRNILLTFTAGGKFPVEVDKKNIVFDTSMTNKIYAGVFEKISEIEKQIGFQSSNHKTISSEEENIRKKLIDKGYFSLEELSRISSVLSFHELDRETKKKIILFSKLSEYVKKKNRYKRQFGIDLILDDSYLDALLDCVSKSETGMRSVNNFLKRTIDSAEKAILEEVGKHKQLILTRDTVDNPKQFYLK